MRLSFKKLFSFIHDKSQRLILYYVVVAAIMFYFMRPGISVSMPKRIVMLGLIIAPIITNVRLLPTVFLLFIGADKASFVHVLPVTDWYYLVIVLAFYALYRKKSFLLLKELAIFSYFYVSAIYLNDVRECFIWMGVGIVLCDMIKNKKDLQLLFHGFLLMTIFLGILFLLYHNDFNHQEILVSQNGETEEVLERTGWANFNVFGSFMAAGGVLAVSYITGVLKFRNSNFSMVISVTTAVVVIVVLALNASRGAAVAFIVPSLFLFLVSNSKLYVKLLFLFVVVMLFYWLYTHNMFDVLSARMENDTVNTAGGRTDIWRAKLYQFFYTLTPRERLFGIGQNGCLTLAIYFSTHNDYLTALIAYGFIGFGLFTYFVLVHPLLKGGKKKILPIIGLLLYLVIEGIMVEPFFRGYFVEIMFYFFVLKYALLDDIENESSIRVPTNK